MINLEKYKHISFDLDGTLVHTVEEYRNKIVPEVVQKLGGEIKDKKAINRFWFEGNRDETICKEFGLTPPVFWKLFRELDTPEKRSARTFAYPDAEKALRKLKSQGKVISIITGAPQWIAKMEIEKLNGAPCNFFLSLTSSKFGNKPDPAGFLFALEKLKINSQNTLYIGNSNEDASFAQNAGVDFLYLERKEHSFSLSDYSIGEINSLDQLA
jgi:HAD superfamily hydrolase (TIGR01549 family)